jgi:FlaA1/EpsC-like NDP-sugar epimerase
MKIFITGISGSLGTEVKNQLKGHTLYGLSRCENKAKALFQEGIYTYIGDVRDRDRLIWAVADCSPDIIFHFAALKHVDVLESHIEMCMETNINGTVNILKAQSQNKIPKLVFSSTDKAVYPVNVYGMCKAISERLVLKNYNNTVTRYGNVIASRGSVINVFREQLKSGKVTITDKEMTRFWITLKNAAQFIIDSGFYRTGLCIPTMKAYKVINIPALLTDEPFEIVETGIRPGEKIHECLSEGIYSNTVEEYTQEEMKGLL